MYYSASLSHFWKNNIAINYAQFTIYPDRLAKNRIIISINAKYLLKTDISQFSLILYFIIKSLQKGKIKLI